MEHYSQQRPVILLYRALTDNSVKMESTMTIKSVRTELKEVESGEMK